MTPAMPHIPLYASEAFKGKSKGGLYGDTIEEIDWAVGQILQSLKREGLEDNTLVVFTSDNGPWLSFKEHGGHALPLRNGKGSSFEGGMRVPCIMKLPGTIPAGAVCSEIASTMDLLPTIGNLAGLPVGHEIDGHDIGDLITDQPGAKTPHDFFLYYKGGKQLIAIRMGDWKLMLAPPAYGLSKKVEAKKYPDHPADFEPELYNLRDDIGETTNLYSQYPELAERLRARAQLEDAR